MNTKWKIASVAFLLWGVLHVAGGLSIAVTAYLSGGPAALGMLGTGLNAGLLRAGTAPITGGVLMFHGYNFAWMGALVAVVAIMAFRRPDRRAYWINMAVVGAADIGLVLFMLVPGYMAVLDGWPGPVLWAVAAIFGWQGLAATREGTLPSNQAVGSEVSYG